MGNPAPMGVKRVTHLSINLNAHVNNVISFDSVFAFLVSIKCTLKFTSQISLTLAKRIDVFLIHPESICVNDYSSWVSTLGRYGCVNVELDC